MDKLILKFVLFIVKTFLKKDVDYEKLKIITETKLILDRRRVRVAMKNNAAKKEPGNQILVTLIVYCFMGLLISTLIPAIKDIVISMTIIHCYVLFMMAMTLGNLGIMQKSHYNPTKLKTLNAMHKFLPIQI